MFELKELYLLSILQKKDCTQASQASRSVGGQDLKHAMMTTEARAIVTVRGYGFYPDIIFDRFRGAQSPVENDVREPDWNCTYSQKDLEDLNDLIVRFRLLSNCSK